MTIHTPKVIERFENFISPEPNTGCWLWAGCVNWRGYGKFGVTSSQQPRAAHRVSFEIYNGPIPESMWVLHHCDTPCCVNPRHLFLGTALDNAKDMYAKGRQRHRSGFIPWNRKLTGEAVIEIRERRKSGALLRELAQQYGVTVTHIHNICTGKNWSA